MSDYLVIKGPEDKLRAWIQSTRANPPEGWEITELHPIVLENIGTSPDNVLCMRSPVIIDRQFEISMLITLGCLSLLTIIPKTEKNTRPLELREQLRLIHRLYTYGLKEFVAEHADVQTRAPYGQARSGWRHLKRE